MNKQEIRDVVAKAVQGGKAMPAPITKKVKPDKRDQRTKDKQAQQARDEDRMMAALRKLHAKDEKKRKKNRSFKPQHVQHPKQRRALQANNPELWSLELRREA